MNFADQKMVKKLRKEFPVGCRIVLDEMDDRQAPPLGTQGTCNGVDDVGNILVSWDTGSHLNVAYGADSCHRVATDAEVKVSLDRLGKTRQTGPRCPRCGAKPDCYDHQQQALSRRADIQICNRCGTEEALEDIAWGGQQKMHLADWAIVKGGVGRMKVLLIKPMEHPQVVDIENSLKEFYRILDCDCITATYPWEERAALVTDDNGLFTEKSFSRYIPELEQPIKGNFFICGLGEEDFAELPQDLIQKFRERFWVPEAFVSMFGQMAVIQMDDGTKPE